MKRYDYKPLIITLLTLCISLSLFSNTTSILSGKVTEQNGEPIAYAVVFLQGTEKCYDRSDEQGRYNITNIPIGTYTLATFNIGYEPFKLENVTIEAGENKSIDIPLQRAKIDMLPSSPFPEIWLSGGLTDAEIITPFSVSFFEDNDDDDDDEVFDAEMVIVVENKKQYAWFRIDGYSYGYDTRKKTWCWLTKTANGEIKSTGKPIHRYDPKKLRLPQNIRVPVKQFWEDWATYEKDRGIIHL